MTKKDPTGKADADEARKKILARRATFIAAALAGVSTACGKEPVPPPQPCLSVVQTTEDGGLVEPMPPPQPCLSPVPVPPTDDAGTPKPCLKVMPPATK